MVSDEDRLQDDDEDVKLTPEGWDAEGDSALQQYYEQLARERRDLEDWARYTLETGDCGCTCRLGWRCQRCRVHAIVYPEPMVREFAEGQVPF